MSWFCAALAESKRPRSSRRSDDDVRARVRVDPAERRLLAHPLGGRERVRGRDRVEDRDPAGDESLQRADDRARM